MFILFWFFFYISSNVSHDIIEVFLVLLFFIFCFITSISHSFISSSSSSSFLFFFSSYPTPCYHHHHHHPFYLTLLLFLITIIHLSFLFIISSSYFMILSSSSLFSFSSYSLFPYHRHPFLHISCFFLSQYVIIFFLTFIQNKEIVFKKDSISHTVPQEPVESCSNARNILIREATKPLSLLFLCTKFINYVLSSL